MNGAMMRTEFMSERQLVARRTSKSEGAFRARLLRAKVMIVTCFLATKSCYGERRTWMP
jgi:hypothetical protein